MHCILDSINKIHWNIKVFSTNLAIERRNVIMIISLVYFLGFFLFYFIAQVIFLKVALQIILPFTRKIIPHLYSFTGLLKSYYWNWKNTVQISNVWPNGANFAITIKKITAENQCVQHKWHINGKINRWKILPKFYLSIFQSWNTFKEKFIQFHRCLKCTDDSNEEIKI